MGGDRPFCRVVNYQDPHRSFCLSTSPKILTELVSRGLEIYLTPARHAVASQPEPASTQLSGAAKQSEAPVKAPIDSLPYPADFAEQPSTSQGGTQAQSGLTAQKHMLGEAQHPQWGQEWTECNRLVDQPAAVAEPSAAAATEHLPTANDEHSAERVTEKKCSQCSATKTPMWRNDIHGNKTLCNACGVRLQRQVNKAKQQAQAATEPPTSLIAGKLPRSRTSPAKLSYQDLSGSTSLESLAPFAPFTLHGSSRTLTLVHSPEGEPRLTIVPTPPKRKQGDAAHSPAPAMELGRKRLCNEQGPASPSAHWDLAPVALIVPARDGKSKRKIENCAVKLEMPQQGHSGVLRVFLDTGMVAATCSSPGGTLDPRYEPQYQAWMWDSPASWSLMFTSQDVCDQFKGLALKWMMHRRADFANSSLDQTAQACLRQDQHTSAVLGSGFRQTYRADEDDLAFLNHINAKIRMHQLPITSGDTQGSPGNPKALTTPLSTATFEKLVETLEFLLKCTESHPHQSFSIHNVALLSQRCAWAPNRAVTLAVYKYWVTKLQKRGRLSCYQRATAGWQHGSGSHLAALSRSFSANPSSTSLLGTSMFHPTSSGLSDVSALSLDELAPLQRRATSETSEDTQTLPSLHSDAVTLPGGMGFSRLAPPASCSIQQGTGSINGPLDRRSLDSQTSGFGMGMQASGWERDHPSGALPPIPPFGNQDADDWEPLDANYLASIADPHEARPSPGEERSDQTTDMEAQKSLSPQGLEDAGVAASVVGPPSAGGLGPQQVSHAEGLHSDSPFQPSTANAAGLRRVVSLMEAPDMLRSASPGTPTSKGHGAILCKHGSLKPTDPAQSRNHRLFPGMLSSALQHQDLIAVEREGDSFLDTVLGMH